MLWNVQLSGPAQKALRKLPAKDAARIKAALLSMEEDPFQGDIQRLNVRSPAGVTAWRRRVGSYRILYDLHFEARLILVADIARRTSTTY